MSFLKPYSINPFSPLILLLLLLTQVGAQPAPPGFWTVPDPPENYQYNTVSSSTAIIIVVFISVLFFMGFFVIYIRHCSDMSSVAVVRNIGNSIRGRTVTPVTRGLDRTILDTFPTFGYSEVKDKKIGKGTLECAVCLNEFEETDTLRLIPKCNHVFHPECIDTWLESHVTCPVCRAILSEPVQTSETETGLGEVSIRIPEEPGQEPVQTSEPVSVPSRSWSVRGNIRLKLPRSHTTGHSLVQPGPSLVQSGENFDRFTLRLPEALRKEVMTRAALNRTTSCLVVGLPTESSSKRGYRIGSGFGEGSGLKWVDPVAKSDRWAFMMVPPFFSRAVSMRSPRGDGGDMADGEGSTSSRTSRVAMKLPSFKCLEPKVDETRLLQGESSTRPSV